VLPVPAQDREPAQAPEQVVAPVQVLAGLAQAVAKGLVLLLALALALALVLAVAALVRDLEGRPQGQARADKRPATLQRYQSPAAVLDALFAARQRIDSGELKSALPKDATPEQITEYRKANGIPDKPEGYLADLPKEIKIEDWNRDAVKAFTEAMHKVHASPEIVRAALAWQNANEDHQIDQRVAADQTLQRETEDALRAEWGNEYRSNINHIHSFLDATAPADVRDRLLDARTADGKPLVGTPEVVRWLAGLARARMPVGSVKGAGAGGDVGANVETRIGAIEKLIADSNSEYWKGAKASSMQQEYRDLVDARERVKARTAA